MEDMIGILCPLQRVLFLITSQNIYCDLCTGFSLGFDSSSYLKGKKAQHRPKQTRVQSVSSQLRPRTAFKPTQTKLNRTNKSGVNAICDFMVCFFLYFCVVAIKMAHLATGIKNTNLCRFSQSLLPD